MASQNGNILIAGNMNGATADQTDKGVIAITGSSVAANNGSVGILGNQVLIGAAADTLQTSSDASRQSTRYSDMDLAAGRRASSSGSADTSTLAGSTVQGSNGASIAAAGLLGVQASRLDAGAGKLSLQGGIVDLEGGLNSASSQQQASQSKSGINSFEDIIAPVPGHAYKGHQTTPPRPPAPPSRPSPWPAAASRSPAPQAT